MTFDVRIEFVNGQSTWTTVDAHSADVAEQAVSDEYAVINLNTVWAVTAHEHGTRPGFRRQGRKV